MLAVHAVNKLGQTNIININMENKGDKTKSAQWQKKLMHGEKKVV